MDCLARKKIELWSGMPWAKQKQSASRKVLPFLGDDILSIRQQPPAPRLWLCHRGEGPLWPTGAPKVPRIPGDIGVKWPCLPCWWGGVLMNHLGPDVGTRARKEELAEATWELENWGVCLRATRRKGGNSTVWRGSQSGEIIYCHYDAFLVYRLVWPMRQEFYSSGCFG